MQPPASDVEADLVHYVPDEVCIRVTAPADRDPAQLYERVRTSLNDALGRELDQPRHVSHSDTFREDVRPQHLRQRFAGRASGGRTPPVLQPLDRPGVSARAASTTVRTPWVGTPAAGDSTTWHFYYAIGQDRVDFGPPHLAERRARLSGVRELVNLLNLHHTGTADPLARDGGWSLAGGGPNWLAVAAQMGCGCPAGLPVAEPRQGRWRFRFGSVVEQALAAAPQAEVVVAVLDTSPQPSDFADRGNAYLREVRDQVHFHTEGSGALGADHFAAPAGVAEYWNTCLPWWHDGLAHASARPTGLNIADHGLFVAGIVHDIAPAAQIHVFRVLNDVGIGDELGLLQVLRDLPRRLLTNDRQRLIVNLSLGATIPVPPRRHWSHWLPRTHAAATATRPLASVDDASANLLDASHATLRGTIDWLRARGVLVVAAAGNDALHEQVCEDTPPPPRYPARYQDAFAVAAATATGAPASYSNRADVPPLGNGITSFGGELARPPSAGGPAVTAADDGSNGRARAIVGLYNAPTFPDGQPNTTGWARWAGTSFSAPIVAGLAARLLAADPDRTPAELMQAIRAMAQPMSQAGPRSADPDGPLDAPLLDAWQDYEPA